MDPAVRLLVDLLSDIANASAQSGDSQYLLTKRLNSILLSPRGEGRAIRDAFLLVSNLYDSGLLGQLSRDHPAPAVRHADGRPRSGLHQQDSGL